MLLLVKGYFFMEIVVSMFTFLLLRIESYNN